MGAFQSPEFMPDSAYATGCKYPNQVLFLLASNLEISGHRPAYICKAGFNQGIAILDEFRNRILQRHALVLFRSGFLELPFPGGFVIE